jgi:hypothetical protein
LQQKNRRKKKGNDMLVPLPSISNRNIKTKEEVDCVFFFSSRRKGKKQREKENAKKGGSLPFFSRFYIWDEALILHPPLNIPSMLNFPPSSGLMFCISSKFYAIQARELSRALEISSGVSGK